MRGRGRHREKGTEREREREREGERERESTVRIEWVAEMYYGSMCLDGSPKISTQ
jgi:hypothetical protein